MSKLKALCVIITATLQWLKKEMNAADSTFTYYIFAALYLTVAATLTLAVLFLIGASLMHFANTGLADLAAQLLSELTDLIRTAD